MLTPMATSGVFFEDANVICTGDIMNSNHRYQQVDFANGGDIRGMIRATDAWLKMGNDQTKVQTGHGPLADKKVIADYNAMAKTARERVEKLVREGKSEAEVVALDPLKDLNTKLGRGSGAGHELPEAGLQLVQALVTNGATA